MNRKLTKVLATATVFYALLAPELAHAGGVSVLSATPAELNDAKGPYNAGVKAMSAGQFEEAIEKFRQSYNIVASPNSRLMLGRALVKVNRLVEAYREFQETIAQATELSESQNKYQKTAESAKKELEELKSELAFVTVIPGTEVSLAGKRLSSAEWGRPQPSMPGTIKVEIKASDGRMREKELKLEPGITKVLTADLTPTGSYSSKPNNESESAEGSDKSGGSHGAGAFSRKQVGYVAGGVGALGVVSFVGLTIMASSIFGNPTDDCDGSNCSRAVVNNANSKGTLRGMSYVALTVGVAGLGVGAYLLLTDKNTASTGSTALFVGPGSLGVSKTF
jgi:TolA-binding protein